MNILYIDHYAGSPLMGMEFRPYQMARHWRAMGDQVLIVAAGYSHLRAANPVLRNKWEFRHGEGVDFLFFRTPAYQGNGLGRIRNIAAFLRGVSRKAERLAQVFRPDVVIASSTYPFDIYPAMKIAGKCGAALIFELHDLWPLTPMELYGYSPYHPMMWAMSAAENRAMLSSRKVVSVLPGADRYMREHGFDSSKFRYIPNGCSLEPEPPSAQTLDIARLLGKYREQGKFLVLYAGSMGVSNSLEAFVQAAELLRERVQFAAIGNGPEKDRLKALALRTGADNLLFLDPVPRSQLQLVLSMADCLYLGAKNSSLYRYGVGMNKLADYMLSARPVLYGVRAINNPVLDSGCGLTIVPEDGAALAKGVRRMMRIPLSQRMEMGAMGRRYVFENHNEYCLAERFRQEMLELVYIRSESH